MYLNFFLVHPKDNSVLYHEKIAYNLEQMAEKAGVYNALWQPHDNGYAYGREVVDTLRKGLKHLCDQPDYYKPFAPQNEQGKYKHLMGFVSDVLEACVKFPDAVIVETQTEI